MRKHRHTPDEQSRNRNILYRIHLSLGPPTEADLKREKNPWAYWDEQRAIAKRNRADGG